MKKFLLALLIIIFLLAGVFVFFATRAFNAENYQQHIEQSILELTGKSLTVRGGTELNWRPMPTITLNDVSLANHSGSKYENMMQAKSISVEIEWASLFKSPLKIKSITLENPTFVLEKLETNQTNWYLPFLFEHKRINDNLSAVISENALEKTQVESIQINNGQLQYINHVNNLSFALSDINGELSVSSLKGPFFFSGDASYQNNNFGIGIQVEQIKEDLPINFTAQLSEHKSDFVLKLNGSATPHLSSSIINAVGEFTLKKPNTLLNLISLPEIPSSVNQPSLGNFTVESTLLKDHLKNLTIRLGEGENALSVNMDVEFKKKTAQNEESYLGSLAINQLDYDMWKPLLSRLNWDFLGGGKVLPYTDLQIHIPQLIYNKKIVRNFETILTYAKGGLLISDGKATLPGTDNTISFSGTGLRKEIAPELSLDIQTKLKNVAEIKSWLNQSLVPDNIKSADLRFTLNVRPTEYSILLNRFQFDNTSLTGYFTYDFENTPQIRTNLSVNNLDLDTYFKPTEKTARIPLFTLPTLLQQEMKKYPALETANTIFDIKGVNITWHTLPISSIRLNGRLNKGTLAIRQFEFQDAASANLKITGNLSGFGKAPFKAEQLSFDFTARQLNLFMNRAGLESRYPLLENAQNVRAQLTLSGAQNKWNIDSNVKLSDTLLGFKGTLYNEQPLTRFEQMAFNVSAPRFKEFLSAVNLPTDTFQNLDGNFSLSALLTGTSEKYTLKDLIFNVGTERLTGTLDVENQNVLKAQGTLNTTLLNAERFLPSFNALKQENNAWNANIIAFEKLDTYDLAFKINANELNYGLLSLENSILDFELKNKNFTLKEFSGKQKKAANSLFKLSGQLSWLNTPTLSAQLNLQRIPLRSNFLNINTLFMGEGSFSLNGTLKTTGRSVSQLIENLAGTGQFELDNNIIIGMDLNQTQDVVKQSLLERYTTDVLSTQIKRSLSAGKTTLIHAAGKWDMAQGIIQSPNTTLQTDVSTSNPTQITWNLPQQSLDILMPIQLNAYPELPTMIATLKQMKGQSTYFVDIDPLLQTLSHQIMQELEQSKLAATQQQNLRKEAEAQTRQEKIKQAVAEAEAAVQQAEQLTLRMPSERTTLLLQNAKDALSFVKTLAIKENLTEAQYNQLMEQSRLAVLRAQETESEILKNDLLETRRNILALSQYGETALKYMETLHERRPYIELLPISIEQTKTELVKINQAADALIETNNLGIINQTILEANQAFQKIQELYENAKRLDPTQPVESDEINPAPIKGSIGRKTSLSNS